jgi:N-ethylmaleimide reductase
MSSALFSALSLSPTLILKNRIVMAPLTRSREGESRIPNTLMAEYYTQRASAGLIIAEATSISEQGLGWLNTPGIYSQEHVEGWKIVTKAVHEAGGKIFLQLWHCGRASHSLFQKNHQLPVSASALAIQNDQIRTSEGKKPYEVPRAMETSEMAGIVSDYVQAARRAKEAGFDGVEIHGANGYLLDQFLQSCTNDRTDAYGGSIENRARLMLDVTKAVCQEWPEGHVALRLSPNGRYNDMGSSPDYRETFLYVAEQLNQFKLAYLHIMDGIGFGAPELGEPMTLKDFRAVYHGVLMGNVDYTQEKAESAINSKDADLIAFGRPYIVNSDLVARFQNGWPVDTTEDMSTWYSFGAEGYTTYPTYAQPPQPARL